MTIPFGTWRPGKTGGITPVSEDLDTDEIYFVTRLI